MLNASDADDHARKRGGGRIGGHGKIRTAVRRSHRPARRRCRRQLADRIRQAAVEAHNCNSARVRAEVQPYRYRRSSVEQFQTRMRTPPMLSVQVFLPCRFPCVVWRIEPSDQCEVAKENDGRANYSKAERKGRLKTTSTSWLQVESSCCSPERRCVKVKISTTGYNGCEAMARPAKFRERPYFLSNNVRYASYPLSFI